MEYGGANEIPAVKVSCRADEFENEIRNIGVEFACEWFGHNADSDFAKEIIQTLCERSGVSHLLSKKKIIIAIDRSQIKNIVINY